jgi:hypothetical protein
MGRGLGDGWRERRWDGWRELMGEEQRRGKGGRPVEEWVWRREREGGRIAGDRRRGLGRGQQTGVAAGHNSRSSRTSRNNLLDADLLPPLRSQLQLHYTQREGFEWPPLSRLGRSNEIEGSRHLHRLAGAADDLIPEARHMFGG